LSFASLIKVDHIIYKQRAYVLISDPNNEEIRTAVAVDHHNCRLGKWYDGAGKQRFGDSPAYRSLVEPHEKVHSCVHEMVTMVGRPWIKDEELQDKIIDAMACAEKGSTGVMQDIDQIIADKYPEFSVK
jgi:hypothetical protein